MIDWTAAVELGPLFESFLGDMDLKEAKDELAAWANDKPLKDPHARAIRRVLKELSACDLRSSEVEGAIGRIDAYLDRVLVSP